MEDEILQVLSTLENYKRSLREDALAGDIEALQLYVEALGVRLSSASYAALLTDEFAGLSNRERAAFVREIVGVATARLFDYSESVAYDSVQTAFKSKGWLITPARATAVTDRIAGLVAGANDYVVKDAFAEGARVLNNSIHNVNQSSVRTLLENSSEKVRELTGSHLQGMRTIHRATACDFCRSLAGKLVPLTPNSGHSHWHDNCNCTIEIEL